MSSKIYNCSLCLYNTDIKFNFNRHMKLKHSIDNKDIIEVKTDIEDKNKDNKHIIEVKTQDNKCVKCNKILSSKKYLQKHLKICNGVSNVLECHLCHKILANSGSKCRHLKTCKKNLSNQSNTNNELLTDGLNNYIYLLKEREFIKTNEPVYKIGKTKQEKLKRYNKYPKGSHLLLHISCFDCDIIEKTILSIFKEKFIHKKDIGYEYFEGNYIDMMRIINNIILNDG